MASFLEKLKKGMGTNVSLDIPDKEEEEDKNQTKSAFIYQKSGTAEDKKIIEEGPAFAKATTDKSAGKAGKIGKMKMKGVPLEKSSVPAVIFQEKKRGRPKKEKEQMPKNFKPWDAKMEIKNEESFEPEIKKMEIKPEIKQEIEQKIMKKEIEIKEQKLRMEEKIKPALNQQKNSPPAFVPQKSGTTMDKLTSKGWFEAEGQLTVDVFETDEEIIVMSAVAGIKPEELDISVENDILIIKGLRKKYAQEQKGKYLFEECFWGRFSREIVLPEEVDSARTQASMKNGILTIKIPKVTKEGKKKIVISDSE